MMPPVQAPSQQYTWAENPLDVFSDSNPREAKEATKTTPTNKENKPGPKCPVPSAKLGLLVAIVAFATAFLPVNKLLGKYIPLFTTTVGRDVSHAALVGTIVSLLATFVLKNGV